jgi:hypothetical protein
MATLLKVLNNLADIKSAGGVAPRVRTQGCMVIVRPDGYVAHVLPLDAYAELEAFFDGFMLQRD